MVIASPCAKVNLRDSYPRIKAKHFHLICPLPFGNNTKIEKISILWGIAASNFGLIYMKVKIGH